MTYRDYDINWDGNRISVKGSVGVQGLRRMCAGLYQTRKRGFSDITLDFSVCNGISEAVMLPFMPIIDKYRQQDDVDFDLTLPQDESLARLFRNANWAYHINPKEYEPTQHQGGHVPALRFDNFDNDETADSDKSDILDNVMQLILGTLKTDRSTLKAVEWSLWEIMDNVSNHAQSLAGGFVQATAYEKANRVEFVVADAGIGIPRSMGIKEHEVALRQVINEGITRDRTKNAGNGLYGSYRVATLSEGQFEINSFNGLLYSTRKGEVVSKKHRTLYPGTSVRCSIGLNDNELLGKALQFKGELHDPPYDYIERRYETDRGEMVFVIKDQAQRDIGSRQGGMRIRGVIKNLLQSHVPVVLDFDGIGVISSSFADEVFGRLFVDMGPRAFMTRIEMRNVDPTVDGLIDRAITQRTRLGNSDV